MTDMAESLAGDDCARRGRQIGSVGVDRVVCRLAQLVGFFTRFEFS